MTSTYILGVICFGFGSYLVVNNLKSLSGSSDSRKGPGKDHFDPAARLHPIEASVNSKSYPYSWDNTSKNDVVDQQTTYLDGKRFYT